MIRKAFISGGVAYHHGMVQPGEPLADYEVIDLGQVINSDLNEYDLLFVPRSADGEVECYDVTENEHRDHILKISRAPAAISDALAAEARAVAGRIATALDYVGVLAVEMFVVKDGASHTVLVNEIAPRVHNSGHWTIDGASVSQFEQHIRAVAGLPLGKPVRHHRVEMTNLLGHDVDDLDRWLKTPGAAVHLYGKTAVRPGRKMGHVTRIIPD